MPNYRRCLIRGGTYFFTVTLANRRNDYLTKHFHCLKKTVQKAKTMHPFKINAWVVLPEHMHALWTLPEGDHEYPKRWRAIKTYFCIELNKCLPGIRQSSIWQRGYWEHLIRDDKDYTAHMDYVHVNPLKHGYVKRVMDWPYSSFHYYVKKGVYSGKWGEDQVFDESLDFGE